MTLFIDLNNQNTNFKICWIVSSSNEQDQICIYSSQLGAFLKIITTLKGVFK